MDKKLIVKQNGLKDCGPSCLLSIMKYYGVEASHEEVSFILKTNINGNNALNIINGSKTFGFDGFGNILLENDMYFPTLRGGWSYTINDNGEVVTVDIQDNDPVQVIFN